MTLCWFSHLRQYNSLPKQTLNLMDIQRTSIISRLSSSNNRNSGSVMSLQRVSSVRNSSLTRRISLVNAMDLQGSLHSNRTGKDSILGMDDSRRQSLFRSSHKEKQGYSYQPDIQEEDLNRKSQFQITHECYCTEEECVGQHCSCYLTPREICVIGQCCDRCLAAKNQFLKQTRGFELEKDYAELQLKEQQHQLAQLLREKNCKNMHYFKQIHANQPCMKGVVFCTCKKSHCQKKYCLCFEKGVKCGEFCKCLECENTKDEDQEFQEEQKRRWERYGTYKRYDQQDNTPHMQIDIQQYLGQRNSNEFPKAMQFQPPNFDHVPYQ